MAFSATIWYFIAYLGPTMCIFCLHNMQKILYQQSTHIHSIKMFKTTIKNGTRNWNLENQQLQHVQIL
jgi:hypothetical protein